MRYSTNELPLPKVYQGGHIFGCMVTANLDGVELPPIVHYASATTMYPVTKDTQKLRDILLAAPEGSVYETHEVSTTYYDHATGKTGFDIVNRFQRAGDNWVRLA